MLSQKSRSQHKIDRLGELKPQNKLVVHQQAPSIPYKDSSYGYEMIDRGGKHLINVGSSYK